MYKWTDANGKIQYSDKPPPAGTNVAGVKNNSSSPVTPVEGVPAVTKGAVKGDAKSAAATKSALPLSTAEQEQAYRKRKLDEDAAQKKAQEKLAQDTQKQENCTNSKNNIITLESGGRQSRQDAKGERYFLDDAQVQAELTKARQQANTFCS